MAERNWASPAIGSSSRAAPTGGVGAAIGRCAYYRVNAARAGFAPFAINPEQLDHSRELRGDRHQGRPW